MDFARFGTALEPALGLQDGDFMRFYLNTKQEAHETAIESSPIAQAIVSFIEVNPEGFEGTASQLLERLKTSASEAQTKEKAWPKDATRLSKALSRLEPDLRAIGIEYTFIRTYKNRLVFLKNKKVASLASSASYPPLGKAFDHDARKNVASCSVIPSVMNPANPFPDHDASNPNHDASENIASRLEPSQDKGYDANDANDAKKALYRGGTQIKTGDRVSFIGSKHDFLEHRDVLEVKSVDGGYAMCDHTTSPIIGIRLPIADLTPIRN